MTSQVLPQHERDRMNGANSMDIIANQQEGFDAAVALLWYEWLILSEQQNVNHRRRNRC